MKKKCSLCDKKWHEENMIHELGLYFNSSCYFYLQNYRLDNERVSLFDAIKSVKALGGTYI